MPKKFAGENSKAAASRARKAAAKEEETIKKQKAIEDEYWKDDDKNLAKKQQKKEEQEKKKQELLAKKALNKQLAEEELKSIQVGGKQSASKVTRAQIVSETEKRNQVAMKAKPQVETHLSKPLEENINRLTIEGEEARTVTEAISILSTKDAEVDLHPERRMKAAYNAFHDANINRIKLENPTMRMSQWKQLLWKEWLKSPENPTNQRN
ncbi:coiled-coil domain-containing protein 124 [Nilaparvata lugens]|uniref:coiled-coil domain-containing protein 124 n=1 Tax=Nilaparvata lugens TaxID=108931 RepID=UPI000B97E6ED|nr:coiled-coil domain-containing protein 124 [Nilaparvata lugens]